jgi:ribonuclease Z
MIDVALLGTGGMMPLPNRFLASMMARVNGRLFLFDCGEGTQVSLKLLGWGFKPIDTVCFTHFHADHISGLPGMLLAIANAGRTERIRFFGPPGIEKVVRSLCIIAPDLSFPMEFYEAGKDFIFYDEDVIVQTLPLRHRGPCFAYSLTLPRRGKFDTQRAVENNVPMKIWSLLQKQNVNDYVYEGRTYSSDMVLGAERKGLKLVYCTDTRPVHGLADFAREADLLICEGMYGDEEKHEKAAAHMHMDFQEAAEIAKNAEAKQLWLTHFSPAMPDPRTFLGAATEIFPETKTGKDRMHTTLRYEDGED